MKLADLANELNIPTESFIKFIQDFDLELSECITTNFDVKEDFVKFARSANFITIHLGGCNQMYKLKKC